MWYGVNLAISDTKRLLRELDNLKSIGIKNLRIIATTQGPDTESYRIMPAMEQWDSKTSNTILDEKHMVKLDLLLDEIGKRDMTAVVMLNNFWWWSGGFSQYVKWFSGKTEPIPYPDSLFDEDGHKRFVNYTQEFYKCQKCMDHYDDVAKRIINRKNTINNILYKDDPTILAWELANGPYPGTYPEAANNWIRKACEAIKEIDKNHMVAIGNTGNLHMNYKDTIQIKCIDYATLHIWPQNFGWYDPKNDNSTFETAVKKTLDYLQSNIEEIHKILKDAKDPKPIVLEEFGIARDKSAFDNKSSTYYRDLYYSTVFQHIHSYMREKKISGVNFWAWAGEGRPKHRTWMPSDEWVGDPPNEDQGWYSVYNTDTTRSVLEKYGRMLSPVYEIKDHTLEMNFWLCVGIPAFIVVFGITLDLLYRRKVAGQESEEDLLVPIEY